MNKPLVYLGLLYQVPIPLFAMFAAAYSPERGEAQSTSSSMLKWLLSMTGSKQSKRLLIFSEEKRIPHNVIVILPATRVGVR